MLFYFLAIMWPHEVFTPLKAYHPSMSQHRGQDSAGMVTTDWDRFREHKGTGMLKDVFSDAETMDKMQGMNSRMQGFNFVSTILRMMIGTSKDSVAAL